MTIEILTALYFIFFFIANAMYFRICRSVMDKTRFHKKLIYVVAFVNSVIFSVIVYGFNQLPTVTYMMVFCGLIIELTILFKNHFTGILMYSILATITLMCMESIIISATTLILGTTLADVIQDHILLTSLIVISWVFCAAITTSVNKFVKAKYLRIINQNREQVYFVLAVLLLAAIYMTLNSFIYGYANNFDPLYLPVHQIIAPLCWLLVVNLTLVILIRFDYLHGYKLKSDILQERIERQNSELIETKERAERDALVDVYNKVATQKKISKALKTSSSGAFFIVDVDDFKNINDTMGHPFGDKVLVFLSKRIINAFRGNDIIGRIGGDEFVIFVKNPPTIELIHKKAEVLSREISVPFADEDGQRVSVSISIGVALAPEHGADFDSLYANADKALYQSKNKGKNTYTIYEG